MSGSSSWRAFRRGALALAVAVGACDAGEVSDPGTDATPVKASEWVSSVNWDQRTVVTVRLVENADGSMAFSPKTLTFEAGKPYVLRIVSPATNRQKHYFSPEGLGSFYKAIATRKIETSQAEYKAPYFNEVELMVGGTLDLYFVPVLAGTYDVVCTIPGHKALGMLGQVTITGGAGYRLDLEVAADFNEALLTDGRRSGSHAVWSARVDHKVSIKDTPSWGFDPRDLSLKQNVGYRITLASPSPNVEKHYYTAADFFRTVVLRKVEDTQAEIKAPYLSAVELMVGGSTMLFVVPTRTGTFEARCTLPQHTEKGMKGTIIVSAS